MAQKKKPLRGKPQLALNVVQNPDKLTFKLSRTIPQALLAGRDDARRRNWQHNPRLFAEFLFQQIQGVASLLRALAEISRVYGGGSERRDP
jgi:hypothetical protein